MFDTLRDNRDEIFQNFSLEKKQVGKTCCKTIALSLRQPNALFFFSLFLHLKTLEQFINTQCVRNKRFFKQKENVSPSTVQVK